MNLFKNVFLASILFVGFAAANGEAKTEVIIESGKEALNTLVDGVKTGGEEVKKVAEDTAKKITEEISKPGFFSNVASGIKNIVWIQPKTFISNHPYYAAMIVAGVATAVVATYVLTAEEDAEEII